MKITIYWGGEEKKQTCLSCWRGHMSVSVAGVSPHDLQQLQIYVAGLELVQAVPLWDLTSQRHLSHITEM